MMGQDFRLGCQTFTWEMLGAGWTGGPDDLLAAIAAAGYTGIEITDKMIGHYIDDPAGFAAALDRAGLTLVAYATASASGYCEASQVAADVARMRETARFVARFPGALISMGSATVMSPGPRAAKHDIAAQVYDACFEAAAAEGVALAVHPSSHHDTLIFDEADYAALFDRMDPRVGWVPDTGHILRGGQSVAAAMTRWRDRIRYVHLKDVDAAGDWAMLGQGVVNVAEVARLAARAPRFTGWLVLEEESDRAGRDPAAAVATNHRVLRRMLAAEGL
ncbi:MAG TPA: myo-inositol catabolism protein [Citreicella sp.]|nr:myo-inositol catabolism protein [Citreicella sp.]